MVGMDTALNILKDLQGHRMILYPKVDRCCRKLGIAFFVRHPMDIDLPLRERFRHGLQHARDALVQKDASDAGRDFLTQGNARKGVSGDVEGVDGSLARKLPYAAYR